MFYLEIIDNTAYRYTYDNVGNITKIEKGSRTTQNSSDVGAGNYTEVCSYVYDALGQLVRENNVVDNKTYVWNYDALGNIDSKLVYDYTTGAVSNPETGIDYQYTNDSKAGWKKLLTSIVYKTYSYTEEYPNGKSTVVSTETVNYDAIGNPTNYQGATVEWYGRQMTSYSKGDVSATFTYDADGLRGSKTVNGSKTTYFYVGDQLMYECRGDGIELYFYYDSYGNLSVIRYVNGTNSYYYYVTTNSHGDVLGIYSATGDLKASYEYDTWGNCTIVSDTSGINIATVNPIRYRGYYYDNDLGLYYLQSRYYDATIGRFINADKRISWVGGSVLGYNMFAYCMNNPVNMSDPTGNWPKWIETAANWVNNNIIQPVKNFFSSSTSAMVATSNSLPYKGEPGSSQTLPNPDGSPKQKRWYGPDGRPERDRDYNHPGEDIPFPHDHEWKDGQRQKDHLPPSPDYEFSLEPVLGVGLVTICVIGIVVVAADDSTGIGVADDFLFGPLGAGVGEGLILIFG